MCAALLVVLGMLLLLIGIYCTHLYLRFTPVYSDIVCEMLPPRLTNWSGPETIFNHLRLEMSSTVKCENPNPYTVILGSSGPGGVWMGRSRTRVGTLTQIREAHLEADGGGSVTADIEVAPTAELLGDGLALLFGIHEPIYLENNLDIRVDIDLPFGGSISMSRSFNKKCGMNMRISSFGGEPVVGPMACADDWDSLGQLPDAVSQVQDKMRFSAESMDGDEIAEGERMKNLSLGSGMAVCYALGLSLLAVSVCILRRVRRHRKAASCEDMEAAAAAEDAARIPVAEARVDAGDAASSISL